MPAAHTLSKSTESGLVETVACHGRNSAALIHNAVFINRQPDQQAVDFA